MVSRLPWPPVSWDRRCTSPCPAEKLTLSYILQGHHQRVWQGQKDRRVPEPREAKPPGGGSSCAQQAPVVQCSSPASRLFTALCLLQSHSTAWSGVFTVSRDSAAIASKCWPHSWHPKKVRMYRLTACSTAWGSSSNPARRDKEEPLGPLGRQCAGTLVSWSGWAPECA